MNSSVRTAIVPPVGLQSSLAAARPDLVAGWHRRVRDFGLREQQRPEFDGLCGTAMRRMLDEHRMLYSHALPVMETLREQIQNTHTMIVLTDHSGLILHSLGDEDFLAQAEGVALRRGVCWSERFMGTNAIGTALADQAATVVHADEHFLEANRFLTCSCAPILDPQGEVIGSLDVSGPQESYHAHTMALVRMSTQMIENKLFAHTFEHCVRLHFHARPEFVGTLMEGIAAFSDDGYLMALNRSAQLQLNLADRDLGRHTLAAVFGCSVPKLFDAARSAPSGLTMLILRNGAKVFARAELHPSAVKSAWRTPLERASAKRVSPLMLSDLATGDESIARIIEQLAKVLHHEVPVIIVGETGTGKEIWARAIHHESLRHDKPFVAVDCASIPESLIESELFGYEEGAFTGARKKGAIGKIALSSGGTLFLDEIGDMPVALQTRLLRALQEREVTPLGSTKAAPVDLHVIAATHRNLRESIEAGLFREDLYYRLNGLTIHLPALRSRGDFKVLANNILAAECCRRTPPHVCPELMEAFARYTWPGNIRQLASVLRTACLMAAGEDSIKPHHLQEDFIAELRARRSPGTASAAPAELTAAGPSQGLDRMRAVAIAAALERCRGNVSAAARALGVSRNTIYRSLKDKAQPQG